MTKAQAVNKVQGAIDRMVDLEQSSDNRIGAMVQRVLDSLRNLEYEIENSTKAKDGVITSQP